ncbi:MAG: hypothetical protein U0X20_03025 [Caldilineaceae bacterium]
MQTATATWDNLPQIVVGALWLNVCLAPALVLAFLGLGTPAAVAGVLLAAPGWVALQRYQMGLVEGRAVPLATLLKAYGHFWMRSVRLGVLGLFLPIVTWLAGVWLTPIGLAVPALIVGLLASFLVGSVLVLYAVPLLVAYDHDIPTVLRNSVILPGRHINSTMGMVALAVLCIFATIYVSSGLMFVLPALYGMFAANNCRLAIAREEAA